VSVGNGAEVRAWHAVMSDWERLDVVREGIERNRSTSVIKPVKMVSFEGIIERTIIKGLRAKRRVSGVNRGVYLAAKLGKSEVTLCFLSCFVDIS